MISWEFVAPDVFSRWAPWCPPRPRSRILVVSGTRTSRHTLRRVKSCVPTGGSEPEDHAVSLLNIAEAGLAEGCVAQRVPAPTVFRARRARNLNDVSDQSIERLDQDFAKAFNKWQALAICRPGAR